MCKIISLFNLKGGVGKTTTNVNLSACLGKQDKRILVLDLDPLGNTTVGYGVDKYMEKNTIFNVLNGEIIIDNAIHSTDFENVDIVPSSSRLFELDRTLGKNEDGEMILKDQLTGSIKDNYDYIFIDCPPGVNMLSLNALIASDTVILPVQCELYSVEAIQQLRKSLIHVQECYNPNLEIEGIVLSMFDGRANLSIQMVEETKKHFKGSLYTTIIPRNIKLAEAPKNGMPVIYYDPRCKGSVAYTELAEEFLELNA